MLLTSNQQNYTPLHYEILQTDFNSVMVNLANMQIGVLDDIPKDVQRISRMMESLSNISIISGNCFFYKQGKDLKVVEQENILFDKNLDIFKLKPTLSNTLEPKQDKNKLITEQKIRIYDKERKVLKSLDDLLIKKETINITTKENRYKYIINIELQEIQLFNNIVLKLNEETLSYPEISEIYYIDNKRNKKSIKIFNNNSYSYNIDLNKNSSNTYEIDFDIIEADNINIVLEDVGLDLLIDSITTNLTEYNEEGYIILEALEEEFPVLKIGIEGKISDTNITFEASHNKEDWYPLDLSNIYDITKTNKVLSWNTVSNNSIKTEEDVRKVYLKIKIKASEKVITYTPKVNREIHSSASFSTISDNLSAYSVYEVTEPTHYGEKSVSSLFNFKELYDRGEYCVYNNQYYAKGFHDTEISKVPSSPYVYSPVTLKTKQIRLSNTKTNFNFVDISSKNIYSYRLESMTKALTDLSQLTCVIPLKEDAVHSIYYIKQNNKEIAIDLSLGFINSAIEVLFITKDREEVYLLDGFKNLIDIVPLQLIKRDSNNEPLFGASLLNTKLFEVDDRIARYYPIKPLENKEIGLLDNKYSYERNTKDLLIFNLITTLLYHKDNISDKNVNYSEIVSEEDYNRSKEKVVQELPSTTKHIKLKKGTVVKGSLSIKEK